MEPTAGHQPERPDSDEALIHRIVRGDEAALGLLYDRYGGRVYSLANCILKDAGAAEEVLQDIFHQLWRNAKSFDSTRGALGTWLLVMARNRSIDRLRRRNPAGTEALLAALPDLGPDIESAAVKNEDTGRVRAALQALPEAQRQAMELAYFEGLTQTEIARRTGSPLGTVKTRLRTALATLRAELGK